MTKIDFVDMFQMVVVNAVGHRHVWLHNCLWLSLPYHVVTNLLHLRCVIVCFVSHLLSGHLLDFY